MFVKITWIQTNRMDKTDTKGIFVNGKDWILPRSFKSWVIKLQRRPWFAKNYFYILKESFYTYICILEKSAPYRNPCSAGGLKEKDPTYSNGIVHHKSHKCKTTSFKSPIWNMLSIQVDNYGWNYITNVTYVLELGLTIFHWNLNPVQNTNKLQNMSKTASFHRSFFKQH